MPKSFLILHSMCTPTIDTHAGQIQVRRGAQSGTKIEEVQPNEMWQLKGFNVDDSRTFWDET